MEKTEKFNAWNSARVWLLFLIFAVCCFWLGIRLSRVDNGSDLTPISQICRDKVITENVSIIYDNNQEYLEYMGELYLLPSEKIISLGEISQDYDGLFNRKIIKSIWFDDDKNDFLYREEVWEKSYQIEKSRKTLANVAVWAHVGALFLWFVGFLLGLVFLFLFFIWVEDLRRMRKAKES